MSLGMSVHFGNYPQFVLGEGFPVKRGLLVKTLAVYSWERRFYVNLESSDGISCKFRRLRLRRASQTHTHTPAMSFLLNPQCVLRGIFLLARKSLRILTESFIHLVRWASFSYSLSDRHGNTYFPFGPAPFRTRLHNTTRYVRFLFAPRFRDVSPQEKKGNGKKCNKNKSSKAGPDGGWQGRDENEMGWIIPWVLTMAQQIYTTRVSTYPARICFWLTSPCDSYTGRNPTDILPVCRLFPRRRPNERRPSSSWHHDARIDNHNA